MCFLSLGVAASVVIEALCVAPIELIEHFTIKLTLLVSLPGLTGQSSIHGRWLLDRPVKPGDDSTEAGRPNRKMLYFGLRAAVPFDRRAAALVRHPAQRQPPILMK